MGRESWLAVVALPPIEGPPSDQEVEDEPEDEPEGVLSFVVSANMYEFAVR